MSDEDEQPPDEQDEDPGTRTPARSSDDLPATAQPLALFTTREKRLADVERWLSEGLTPRQASRRAREEFGLKRGMSDAYVAVVLKRWAIDAADEPKESKRERLRSTLERAIQLAFERKQLVRFGRDGLREVSDPDVKAVARLGQTLALLDGLIDRTGPNVEAVVRARMEAEREAFVAAVRGVVGEEAFERIAGIVAGTGTGPHGPRPAGGTATPGPDSDDG